jgi:hypothetical protein
MNKAKLKKVIELYNLTLVGLIGLALEQKSRSLVVNETIFLGRWLKRIKKQRCYPKSLAGEIDYFLDLYLLKGRNADLANAFNKIYTELKIVQNVHLKNELADKVKFDAAMKVLAGSGWHVSLPITHDPKTGIPYRPEHLKEIFTTKWYWNDAFDEQQTLAKELSIFVVSDPQKVIDCLYHYGFISVKGMTSKDEQGNCFYQYILFPDNEYTGDIAYPSEFLV